MNHPPPEKLLPKEAIAELLGVKPRTVLVWYERGKFDGIKVGKRAVRFYWSVVERAMVKKETKP